MITNHYIRRELSGEFCIAIMQQENAIMKLERPNFRYNRTRWFRFGSGVTYWNFQHSHYTRFVSKYGHMWPIKWDQRKGTRDKMSSYRLTLFGGFSDHYFESIQRKHIRSCQHSNAFERFIPFIRSLFWHKQYFYSFIDSLIECMWLLSHAKFICCICESNVEQMAHTYRLL